jgi:enoyl-CoA hydratase
LDVQRAKGGGDVVSETNAGLLVEVRDRIMVMTLNRPEVRNAIDRPLAEAIAAALDALEGDPGISVGVITGAGRGFCSGMDLKAFAASGDRPWGGDRGFAGIVRRPPVKPMVAAVEGFAVAGGLEIALACDLIVAARGSLLGVPEVKRGLVAAGGALRRLPRAVPLAVAMEMSLTGDPLDAERAYAVGLVNRLTEPGAALETAVELATNIAGNGPLAVAATKVILSDQTGWGDQEFWLRQSELVDPILASEDALEGARAFNEKRAPRWVAR